MSQFGMQMPGGQMQRGPTLNIYTGLLGAAVIALLAACVFVAMQAQKVGPKDNPLFSTHTYNATNKSFDIKLTDDAK